MIFQYYNLYFDCVYYRSPKLDKYYDLLRRQSFLITRKLTNTHK